MNEADLAHELATQRCVAIVDEVREHQKAFEVDGLPTPFSAGFDLACEEIKHRIEFEPWVFAQPDSPASELEMK